MKVDVQLDVAEAVAFARCKELVAQRAVLQVLIWPSEPAEGVVVRNARRQTPPFGREVDYTKRQNS